ncbi:MAG: nucleotide exchange factor GrpE [Kiritimatiellae bacterium]|nr:nucleotide exchange factor GrpE [Kiritimatiellia bacterium]
MSGKDKKAKQEESERPEKTPAPDDAGDAGAEKEPDGTAAEEAAGQETEKPEAKAEPDWKDRYARLLADFDNYKKRAARDREDTFRFVQAEVLGAILPAVDNLGLALANAKDRDDEFVKGVRLVNDGLLKTLKDQGAEPFDCVGKDLDIEKMEAIATLPNDEVPEGKVAIESKRGWMLKDKVLRAAQVVVSSGKANG